MTDTYRDSVSSLLVGLRSRRAEIEDTIFARVRKVAHEPWVDDDTEYLEGLRATVAAVVDYCLAGIGGSGAVFVPSEVASQAARAAHGGVSLDAVVRRYMVGSALLWDFFAEEADRVGLEHMQSVLRGLLRVQSLLLDDLVVAAAQAHKAALEPATSSHEQRLGEQVRRLLAGEPIDIGGFGYEMEREHLGVIATGPGCQEMLRLLAREMDCGLLSVPDSGYTVWAWFGGYRALDMAELERAFTRLVGRGAVSRSRLGAMSFSVGERARDVDGWRLTHEQAKAAQLVARRRPQRFTRYTDVALVAAALRDRTIAQSLLKAYLSPLEDARDGGEALRGTLRAYLDAERNVSCTASALNVARTTVESRLRSIEERLGRSLRLYSSELEVALRLYDLGVRITVKR